MNSPTDEDLMLRIQQANDPEAFAELFARYRARITSYICRLMGDRDEGESLAQETFLYRAKVTSDALAGRYKPELDE